MRKLKIRSLKFISVMINLGCAIAVFQTMVGFGISVIGFGFSKIFG
jgi:hypothetical protein